MRRLIVALLLMVLVSGCQAFSGFLVSDPPDSPTATIPATSTSLAPTATSTPLPPEPTAVSTTIPAQPFLLVSRLLDDSSQNPPYTLTVDYPQFEGANLSPQLQAFNQFSEQKAQVLLESYQTQLTNPPGTPDPNFYPTFMKATYQVTHGTDGLLSILYTVADYWSGAAHPNSYARVLNFNLITGQEIALGDLFLPGANYLKAISDYCIDNLKKQDRLMFDAGAQPTTDNYQNWSLTSQGLLISFDPYQVGPYAMGPSSVTIPFEDLKQDLDPDGPLAPYLP